MLIVENFLSANECNQLNSWVDLGIEKKWLDEGMTEGIDKNSKSRVTTRKYGDRFTYPFFVYDVFNKITNKFNLKDLSKSIVGGGNDGIVVSCTFPGGDVFKHIDPKEGNTHILRCNVLTRKADNGGELYVGGNKIDINVGDLHCYLPSTIDHYVTEVKGQTSRVLWMFGYQCSVKRFNELCQHHKQT